MEINDIAEDLNELAREYSVGTLQTIRKELKNLTHPNTYKIFSAKTIKDKYAFHSGGRSELQFNIGFESINEKDCLRFGVAFSLETNRTLLDISVLMPNIRRFNEFISLYKSDFQGFELWYWKGDKRHLTAEKTISSVLVKPDVFIFFGKYTEIENYRPETVLETFDKLLPLYRYVEGLPNAEPKQAPGKTTFYFQPNNFNPPVTSNYTKAEQHIEVDLRHNRIQASLMEELRSQYGNNNVSAESSSGIENRVDITLKVNNEYWFYEIKTGGTARTCIREAIGQLLEYSYWPGAQNASKLFIVGESPLDRSAKEYLNIIREKFLLPIYYRQQKVYDLAD